MDVKEWETRELIQDHAEWLKHCAWDRFVTKEEIKRHANRVLTLIENLEWDESGMSKND